jgi:hypothetical protein
MVWFPVSRSEPSPSQQKRVPITRHCHFCSSLQAKPFQSPLPVPERPIDPIKYLRMPHTLAAPTYCFSTSLREVLSKDILGGHFLDPPGLADLCRTVRMGMKCHCATLSVRVEGHSSHWTLNCDSELHTRFLIVTLWTHLVHLPPQDQMEPPICCRRANWQHVDQSRHG